jgi:steroid delta-isomerase-like uncharacterized protein
MNKLAWLCSAVVAFGCKGKSAEQAPPAPSGSGSGSASSAGSGSGSVASAGSGSAGSGSAAAAPLTSEAAAARLEACWAARNAHAWKDLEGCYTPDAVVEIPGLDVQRGAVVILDAAKAIATSFPDEKATLELVLANGPNVATMALITGTQAAALKTPFETVPATQHKVGFQLGQVSVFEPDGRASHEYRFFDLSTILGQLRPDKEHPVRAIADAQPKQLVIAKNDDHEKANRAAVFSLVEAFNHHDTKAVGALLADDLAWSDVAMPADLAKPALLDHLATMWKGFSDLNIGVMTAWTAGDYVVAIETLQGTNDGDLPAMHVKKTGKKIALPVLAIHQLVGGKVKSTWLFEQGQSLARQLGLVGSPAKH